MNKIRIKFSKPHFQKFLDHFDEEKQEAIKQRMKDYANDVYPLPFTKTCKEVGKQALKILVPDFEVVIIFDDLGDVWELIEGYSYFPRVS